MKFGDNVSLYGKKRKRACDEDLSSDESDSNANLKSNSKKPYKSTMSQAFQSILSDPKMVFLLYTYLIYLI